EKSDFTLDNMNRCGINSSYNWRPIRTTSECFSIVNYEVKTNTPIPVGSPISNRFREGGGDEVMGGVGDEVIGGVDEVIGVVGE
ncbi:24442_t:CDS:2, partial [Dentiscutata erythropus]